MSTGGIRTGVGIVLTAIAVPSFVAVLIVLVFVLFKGRDVVANDTLLSMYIIGAMVCGYVLPIALALVDGRIRWLFIVSVITTVLLLAPSSVVASGGCNAGEERAIYAMRALPLLELGYRGLILVGHDPQFTCNGFAT